MTEDKGKLLISTSKGMLRVQKLILIFAAGVPWFFGFYFLFGWIWFGGVFPTLGLLFCVYMIASFILGTFVVVIAHKTRPLHLHENGVQNLSDGFLKFSFRMFDQLDRVEIDTEGLWTNIRFWYRRRWRMMFSTLALSDKDREDVDIEELAGFLRSKGLEVTFRGHIEKGRVLLEESEEHFRSDRRTALFFTIMAWVGAIVVPVVYAALHHEDLLEFAVGMFLSLFNFSFGVIILPAFLRRNPVRMHEKGVDNLKIGYLRRRYVPFEDVWYCVVHPYDSKAVIWFYVKRKFLGMTWSGFLAEEDDGFVERLQEVIDFLNSKGVKAGFRREMAALGVKVIG